MLRAIALMAVIGISLQNDADEGCNSTHPLRGADGDCMKHLNDSTMLIPSFCSNFQKNYQCVNNTCVGSYAECVQLSNLNIQNRTKCASSSHKRCNDGYCRLNCDLLKYSNCPMDQPIKCGDGRCVNFEFQCFSFSCPLDKPYLCPNMDCATFLKNCTDTMAYRSFKPLSVSYNLGASMSKIGVDIDGIEKNGLLSTHLFTVNSNFEIFAPPLNSPNQQLLNGKAFNGNCSLHVTPVSRLELLKVNNTIESNRSISFDESYPFQHMTVLSYFTVRSSVINITTSGRLDNNEYFGRPVLVKFTYDRIKVPATKPHILKV